VLLNEWWAFYTADDLTRLTAHGQHDEHDGHDDETVSDRHKIASIQIRTKICFFVSIVFIVLP